mgnify:CR=1 FL=1
MRFRNDVQIAPLQVAIDVVAGDAIGQQRLRLFRQRETLTRLVLTQLPRDLLLARRKPGANLPAEFVFDAPLTALNGTSTTPVTTATDNNPANDGHIVTGLQLLAIDKTTSNGVPVLEASVEDLFNLVNTSDHTIADNGYSLNYSPQSNWFWVSAPADFEGKVYTFAWENTAFQAGFK